MVAAFNAAPASADASHRWIRNMVGEDFCLDSNAAGVGAQYWRHWRYGWFQRPGYASVSRPGCLAANGRRVFVTTCDDP